MSKVHRAPGVVLPQPGGQRVLKNHPNMSVMKCVEAVKTGGETREEGRSTQREGPREAPRSGRAGAVPGTSKGLSGWSLVSRGEGAVGNWGCGQSRLVEGHGARVGGAEFVPGAIESSGRVVRGGDT